MPILRCADSTDWRSRCRQFRSGPRHQLYVRVRL